MQNVTLEMSLKPFKSVDAAYVARVCEKIFRQWRGLAAEAETVSVMLWTADGSEILDYKGRMDDRIEWARYIGGANPPPPEPGKPPRTDLHGANYLYMPNPPEITYATLKRIVATLKEVGRRVLDKPIRVGATFDPGPEFAKSPFKYQRHREICMGNTMGYTLWVCCYATLNEDHEPYAGWPQGIPQGTPFGTFFGRQCQHFLTDLDFDFIWFSNGFGFGRDTWNATGAVFDGESVPHRTGQGDPRRHPRFLAAVPRRVSALPGPDARHQHVDGRGPGQRRRAAEGHLRGRLQHAAAAELALGGAGRRFRHRAGRLHVPHRQAAGPALHVPLLRSRSLVAQQPVARSLRPSAARHLSAAVGRPH